MAWNKSSLGFFCRSLGWLFKKIFNPFRWGISNAEEYAIQYLDSKNYLTEEVKSFLLLCRMPPSIISNFTWTLRLGLGIFAADFFNLHIKLGKLKFIDRSFIHIYWRKNSEKLSSVLWNNKSVVMYIKTGVFIEHTFLYFSQKFTQMWFVEEFPNQLIKSPHHWLQTVILVLLYLCYIFSKVFW